jgi:hypothetical protein
MMKLLPQLRRARTPRFYVRWLVLLVALAGCDRNEIKAYRVAKEPSPPPPPIQENEKPLPAGHPDVASPSPAPLTWTAPPGWESLTPGEMRVASFKVTGQGGKQADVSIVPLGGFGGGDAANVNRWRGQVGLAAASSEELKQVAQPVEIGGQPADLYDVAGRNPDNGNPARILAAIQHRDGSAWFFKMTGDDELVAAQKGAFIGFLKSLKFEAPEAMALPPSHLPIAGGNLPAGHPDIADPAPTGVTAADESRPNWKVPSGWREIDAGQFLVAKFAINGDNDTQATVNVSHSAGDGGGLAANVNRWRNQLGLGPLAEGEVERLSAPSELVVPGSTPAGKAMFVDMSQTNSNTGQSVRLIGAMVPLAGETWFYKLMGDGKIVKREKEAFNRFVQTATY